MSVGGTQGSCVALDVGGFGVRESAWLGRHNTAGGGGVGRPIQGCRSGWAPTQMISPQPPVSAPVTHTFGVPGHESAAGTETACRGDSLNAYHDSPILQGSLSQRPKEGKKTELWACARPEEGLTQRKPRGDHGLATFCWPTAQRKAQC